MFFAVAVLVTAVLFGGFLALTTVEYKRGFRVFAASRDALDARIERAALVFRRVDILALLAHLMKAVIAFVAHEIAHGSLMFVRGVERILTQTVREVRTHRDSAVGSTYSSRAIARVKHALRYKKVNVQGKGEEEVR